MCWLGTSLEFAPLKVSGSISSGVNFGGPEHVFTGGPKPSRSGENCHKIKIY
jgi:hypothetical protein